MKKNRRAIPMIAYLLLLFAVFSWANNLFSDNLSQIPYSQIEELFRQEQVKAFEIQDDVITMELYGTVNGENIVRANLAYPEYFLTEKILNIKYPAVSISSAMASGTLKKKVITVKISNNANIAYSGLLKVGLKLCLFIKKYSFSKQKLTLP